MLSRLWKFTLAWEIIVLIMLQSTVAPALTVPYGAILPTLATATQLPQPDPKFIFKVGRDSMTAIAPEYKDQSKVEFAGQIEQVAFALK
jgi:hypothetical protein